MPDLGWNNVAVITGDETGRLFGVARSGNGDGHYLIWVADVSAETLQAPGAQDANTSLNGVPITQVVTAAPVIDFDVTAAAASADGHQLLLVGSTRQDINVPVLALVDLYGSQPASAGSSNNSSHPAAKQRLASLLHVHQGLYAERPGLRILQVAWHPSSSRHFATLTSDNRWRLYNTNNLAEAEQTYALHLPGTQTSLGIHRSSGPTPRFTAFAFGPLAAGWASLSVMLLTSDGGVYLLCPVAPFGLRMSASVLQRLFNSAEGTAHAWLLAAFLSILAHESEAVSARPHMLETAAPALQGPLNQDTDSVKPHTTNSLACTLAVSNTSGNINGLGSLSLGNQGSMEQAVFSVLVTGFSNGTVYAHALEVGQVIPVWLDATPQCAYDQTGEIAAVRYEVEVVPTASADAGLTPVPENAQQSGGAASADNLSPLLLLDALKINLHLPPGAGIESPDDDLFPEAGPISPADSDEESDAGYDPSAARGRGLVSSSSGQQRQRCSGGLGNSRINRSAGGFGVGVIGLLDEDADDDLEDRQLQQLHRVTLHAAPELPGRFWACHDQGCWGVNVRWLQQLSSKLSAAAADGDGDVPQQSERGALLTPSLQELLVSGSQVKSSCVVGNALLGSSCVVLEGSGELSILRPTPAGVLGEGVLAGADAAAEDDVLGLLDVQLTSDELDTKSRMEDFYADICRGPRRLPPPPKPQNLSELTAADPAGLKYLNDMTSWLVATHVQFATGAHADLVERLKQLHSEVTEQSSAVSALQDLAASAVSHQSQLAARLERLTEIGSNLSERAQLLAGLHWNLPRPPSKEEQQLDKQLEVWEQRLQELKVAWRALRGRLDTYTAAAPQQQQQQSSMPDTAATGRFGHQVLGFSSSRSSRVLGVPALAASMAQTMAQTTKPLVGPVVQTQLAKLKEQLVTQTNTITKAQLKLDGLFDELAGFKAEHPEVELPSRLRDKVVV